MCAKTHKLIQTAKAAGYVPDSKHTSYTVCQACKHKRVLWFTKAIKSKGRKRALGPDPYGACFGCGARFQEKGGNIIRINVLSK